MLKAQSKVVDIMCNLELIYHPAFFDIMIHLVIHLPLEALEGGPIRPCGCFHLKDSRRTKSATSELFALACGPTPTPISVNSCVVNGVRFVVHSHDERRTTQNNDICLPGGKDGEMYYGQLQEILEFLYLSFKVVLFRVKWFDTSNEGRKVKYLVLRNNMTQILTKAEAFNDDQYILATQVKQCFYLKDIARRQPHWKEDPKVMHFDNSSDLPLFTSLNDLDNVTLHIDVQSTEVDAPPDIIDLAKDDDIIDDEDALPHDLAYSDEEDLVNVDDDDGVDMSADVSQGHSGDGNGDDRPPTHHIPTSCRGCFVNQGELIKEIPLYYPSWQKVPAKRKAVIVTKIGIGMPRFPSGMIPGTKPEPLKIAKTAQRAWSYADKDPGHLLAFEFRWLQALGSNTPSGVPYTEEEIDALARKGKQWGYLLGVGRVLPRKATKVLSLPSPQCTHNFVDVEKLKKKNKHLTKQVNLMMKLFRSVDKFSQMLNQYKSSPEFGNVSESGGCKDDDDDGKDEEDEEDGNS
nr:hypothetical protein [Tanacetum cinerariifolium]